MNKFSNFNEKLKGTPSKNGRVFERKTIILIKTNI